MWLSGVFFTFFSFSREKHSTNLVSFDTNFERHRRFLIFFLSDQTFLLLPGKLDTLHQLPFRWLQARTQGGSPLPMNPPRSFKFRFKINGMRAHWARARFRDRSRPCFIACRGKRHSIFHSTFKDLIVALRARPCSSGRGVTDCAV